MKNKKLVLAIVVIVIVIGATFTANSSMFQGAFKSNFGGNNKNSDQDNTQLQGNQVVEQEESGGRLQDSARAGGRDNDGDDSDAAIMGVASGDFLTSGGTPDLAVTGITGGGSEPLEVTISNLGNGDVTLPGDGTPHFTIYVDGWEHSTIFIGNFGFDAEFLFAGGSESRTFSGVDISTADDVEACIDSSDAIEESNESNNCLEEEVTAYPDLVVTEIDENTNNEIYFVVANEGDADVPFSNNDVSNPKVNLYVDGSMWTSYYPWNFANVVNNDNEFYEAGGESTFNPGFSMDSIVGRTVEVCADVDDTIWEEDENNNCLTVDF